MARFFIDRPIFAWVVALLVSLAGLLSLSSLPVAQYPDIAPPTVTVSATYPGASPRIVEEAVTAIIEREMNGAPGLMHISSSSMTGMASITLSFKQGTNPDLAAVEVQNRLKVVESRMPEVVRRNGIKVEKAAENVQLVVSLTSTNPLFDQTDLGELASSTLLDPLRRLEGVGSVTVWGAEYAIRIWPDPVKLAAFGLTAADVSARVRTYNERMIIGELGNLAVPDDAPLSANVVAGDQLTTPEEFADIPLRIREDGSAIRLGDVARIEMGADLYSFRARVNGKPATALGIKMAPGSNVVQVVEDMRIMLDEQMQYLPAGVEYQIPYESSTFVKISIQKVLATLIEAVILVFLVMYLFMQNFRVTLIPTLVVPIALLGTFVVMHLAGFSINVLTMFGMVLAVGIVVDDAIVVVENVERHMVEEGMSPYEATVEAMKQISGAIIGITAVLISVFIPMAFFSGAVGNIYRQFSVTLAVSIAFSAFFALSLTPALCATLLKPVPEGHHEKRGFFGWFNRMFTRNTQRYQNGVSKVLKRPVRSGLVYLIIVAMVAFLFVRLPSAFLPDEDQGSFMIMVSEPQGATMEETMATVGEIEQYLLQNEPVESTFGLGGFSFFGAGPNSGMLFVTLKNWSERGSDEHHVQAIVDRVNMHFYGRPDRMVYALNLPALPELGGSGGFDLRLQKRADVDYATFAAARDQLIALAAQDSRLAGVMFAGIPDVPQLTLQLDRNKAETLGVSIDDINATLAIMFGSDYTGDFMLGNQVRKIYIQADGAHRLSPDDIGKLEVRNQNGNMVKLASFIDLQWEVGPPALARFNGYPAFNITGNAAPGFSSGEAMAAMEELAQQLPAGYSLAWTGQSYEERLSGAQVPMLFGLSILVVFLVLAALYESWFIPAAVILVVPLGVIGSILGVMVQGMPNDIYFKVGLIAIIGLSAKNAILIVEVAKDFYRDGMDIYDAVMEAARVRLRPIIMTSVSFGVGLLPLMLATGASSSAQRAIGTAVICGMITATVLAVYLVPLFFFALGRFIKNKPLRRPATVEVQS